MSLLSFPSFYLPPISAFPSQLNQAFIKPSPSASGVENFKNTEEVFNYLVSTNTLQARVPSLPLPMLNSTFPCIPSLSNHLPQNMFRAEIVQMPPLVQRPPQPVVIPEPIQTSPSSPTHTRRPVAPLRRRPPAPKTTPSRLFHVINPKIKIDMNKLNRLAKKKFNYSVIKENIKIVEEMFNNACSFENVVIFLQEKGYTASSYHFPAKIRNLTDIRGYKTSKNQELAKCILKDSTTLDNIDNKKFPAAMPLLRTFIKGVIRYYWHTHTVSYDKSKLKYADCNDWHFEKVQKFYQAYCEKPGNFESYVNSQSVENLESLFKFSSSPQE